MQIADLKASVSELSDEELLNKIRDIRATRRIPKPTKEKVEKTATAKVAKSSASIESMLANLSPDQLTDMIAKLENERSK